MLDSYSIFFMLLMFLITTFAYFEAFHLSALLTVEVLTWFQMLGIQGQNKKHLQWELFIRCLELNYWITSLALDRLPYPPCLSNAHISIKVIFTSCVWKEKLQILLLLHTKCTRIYHARRETENDSEEKRKKKIYPYAIYWPSICLRTRAD